MILAAAARRPERGVFETYSNVVNMNWTLTDVRIRLLSCCRFQTMIVLHGKTSTEYY